MAKVAAETEQALRVVARYLAAETIEENNSGLDGFAELFRRRLPVADQAIIADFETMAIRETRDMGVELEQDKRRPLAEINAETEARSHG
jgi:hypothetical protein